VIGSNTGGIPTIIRPGETGRLVPAGDSGALAAAIQSALSESEITHAMAKRGRKFVEREHSLDAMFDQLDALYRRYLRVTT
jgi:glycosyltransferase involved in cell wall biosynthesis